jgi:hypothetical protein
MAAAAACGEQPFASSPHACPEDVSACARINGLVTNAPGNPHTQALVWFEFSRATSGGYSYRWDAFDQLGRFRVTFIRHLPPDTLPEPDTLTVRCLAMDMFDHDLRDSTEAVLEFVPPGSVPPAAKPELVLERRP